MLKHATISRTSQAQQALQLQLHRQRNQQVQQTGNLPPETDRLSPIERQLSELLKSTTSLSPALATTEGLIEHPNDLNNNNINVVHSPSPQRAPSTVSHSTSPSPSLMSTPSKSMKSYPFRSTLNSLTRSPSQQTNTLGNRSRTLCSSESMIKVFAQTLSQDVEYVTLHVNAQTKSNQVVKSLLKKFRLKHRDPNLYHLTLERWIRKDGLKYKSVMLLGDEASPLQLQQCCSNPPHNDIKFTLQMRSGTLVKVFCSDVAPDSRYKCLSLSAHTTVEETIELMLHCLNLITPNVAQTTTTCITNNNSHHMRSSDSPSSTGSSSSSDSSSSGIESDPTCLLNHRTDHGPPNHHNPTITPSLTTHQLDSRSRASSVTSISSSSNVSNVSTSIMEQYCLVIECKDTNFCRTLDSDEYLVDVYQSLLNEAKGQNVEGLTVVTDNINDELIKQKQSTDQWFLIKLKRRDHQNIIKFTNPRQNIPLPPIPLSMSQFGNADNLQNIVSTAQIEVNSRPNSTLPITSSVDMYKLDQRSKAPPPPSTIVLLQPPIRPRRRNLSNASSTFGRPLVANSSRRRYDPAQLAEDLSRLNIRESGIGGLSMNSDQHS